MRDYAELIHDLRCCSDVGTCNSCSREKDSNMERCDSIEREAADAIEELLAVRMINLTEKCGSCEFFKPNFPTASGWCKARKYGDDVVHDPENPYPYVARSRLKCKLYKPPTEPPKGVE